MGERGFANHAMMGAVLLGGVWLAIYLPSLAPITTTEGWMAWLARASVLVGTLGGPILLVYIEGDEMFGVLGILAALFFGWASAYLAFLMKWSPSAIASVRLFFAALGPIALYLSFRLS